MTSQMLSPHFALAEFACRDGTPVPPQAIPALERLCRHYLEPLRGRYGAVTVLSGHRSPRHNAEVGGAPLSQHVMGEHGWGVAADVKCRRGTPRDWYDTLDALGVGGLGLYRTWVHADNRRGRARW